MLFIHSTPRRTMWSGSFKYLKCTLSPLLRWQPHPIHDLPLLRVTDTCRVKPVGQLIGWARRSPLSACLWAVQREGRCEAPYPLLWEGLRLAHLLECHEGRPLILLLSWELTKGCCIALLLSRTSQGSVASAWRYGSAFVASGIWPHRFVRALPALLGWPPLLQRISLS